MKESRKKRLWKCDRCKAITKERIDPIFKDTVGYSIPYDYTREQLEKIILGKFVELGNLDQREVEKEVQNHGLLNIQKWDDPQAGFFDMKEYAHKTAAAILSAIKIDEIKLRGLWGELYTQEPFKNTVLDAGLGIAYIKLIASHAQEIIKFEEE